VLRGLLVVLLWKYFREYLADVVKAGVPVLDTARSGRYGDQLRKQELAILR
jgi:hypothetical protein